MQNAESRALAPLGSADIAPAQPQFSDEQRNLIRETVAKGTSDLEFELFIAVCQRTGLDPFSRQIYAIVRKERQSDGSYKGRMQIQTGIDGYYLLASRTGELAGIDDVIYDAEDQPHPNRATVTVYRMIRGQRIPFTASARWREYVQEKDGKPTGLWGRMPYRMLGKCAEALALRRAFPAETSGVYTTEEMLQADNDPTSYIEADVVSHTAQATASQESAPSAKVRKLSWGSLRKRARDAGVETQADWEQFCRQLTGKTDAKTYGEIDYVKVETAIAKLEQARDEAEANAAYEAAISESQLPTTVVDVPFAAQGE